MSYRKKIALRALLVVAMSLLIFYFSSQNGTDSGNLSTGFLKMLGFSSYQINKMHFLGRKMAHITEYFLLTLLTARLLKVTKYKNKILLTFIYPFLFAVSDEFHQTFIPGRSGQITDIFVDSIGICIAVTFLIILKYFQKKENNFEPL